MPTPSAAITAILSGWACAWAAAQVGFSGVPTVLLGLLVWAAVHGAYRRNARA